MNENDKKGAEITIWIIKLIRAKTSFNFFIFIDENKSLIKHNIFIKTWWLECSTPPTDTHLPLAPALYLTWRNTLITFNP
jgi:hypothetical protein